MYVGGVLLVLAVVGVEILEASVIYTVADLGVIVDTDGRVTVGKVPAESVTLNPTDDPYHVTMEVRKLSLFDSENTLIKEYNFSANLGSFDAEADPVHDLDGIAVDGRRMSATGLLSGALGANIMDFNAYVFIKSGTATLGEQPVDVKLYDTKVEIALGPVADTEECIQCTERLDHMQLDIRLTSSGPSRMAVKSGITKVQKTGGVQFLLPNAVIVDGAVQTTENNPEIEIDGDHVDVSLAVPPFTDRAVYQALVVPSQPDATTPPPTPVPEEEEEEGTEEEEIQTEAEYSFSTKPSDREEGVVVGDGQAGDIDEGEETGDGSTAVDGDSNNASHSVVGISSMVLAVLVSILALH